MRLSSLVKTARTLRNLRYVRNYGVASKLANIPMHPNACVYDGRTGTCWVRDLDLKLAPQHHDMLPWLSQARALKEIGVRFVNEGTEVVAHTGAFSVNVETPEVLYILGEILSEGVYNFVSGRQDVVVVDVGMNVGTASLFFASQPSVQAVWSYEPVGDTYAAALRNFARNPELARKIKAHNYGVSAKDGQVTFDFCAHWKGSAGLCGLPPAIRSRHGIEPGDVRPITVEVRSICEVVRSVRTVHPDAEVIMKVDCEGSEYDIFAALARAGMLRDIDAFLVEWHQRGPQEIEQLLAGAGFFILSFTPHSSQTGMVYAVEVVRSK